MERTIKKVLVTGAGGQLGYDVVEKLREGGYEAIGVDIADFARTDRAAARRVIVDGSPDAVIQCSAYTAVDKAESDREACFRINEQGSGNIAAACAETGAGLVYISTDYVYGGGGCAPFETDDPTAPPNVYGQSKLAGENACKRHTDKLYIVRTSWVFGKNGNNFIKTMLRLGREKPSLNVVADQIGSPTYTRDLADFLVYLAGTSKYGVYHFSNEGFCSWCGFAREIFRQSGISTPVNAVTTAEYKTAAARPLNSRLSKSSAYAAGYKTIPTWQNAAARYRKEIGEI
jgi:dTDP-4-dehydrorhamnose reductase